MISSNLYVAGTSISSYEAVTAQAEANDGGGSDEATRERGLQAFQDHVSCVLGEIAGLV
jgi:hypothetical protein